MNRTSDEEIRQRFYQKLDQNFSVIASAGSGKTRAITNRIVAIARHPDGLQLLPKLVVVTYTNRAADEMQQRSREEIVKANLPLAVVEAFNRAFFGTIHSFCVKLLSAYGHHLGLPPSLELITEDDDLWSQFVQEQAVIGKSLSTENRRILLRHVQARQLMELARSSEFDLSALQPDSPCPNTDFSQVYQAVAKGNAARNISRAQEELKRWEQRWRETDHFVPWPPCATSAKDFVARWRDAFAPLREWVNSCALCVAAEVQRDYRDFRLERGVVNYADQIALAAQLLSHPEVARQIRDKDYHVILDEAQDTDPQQFFVLLEITRPPAAQGTWTQEQHDSPRPGRFCMVGDFQQSIYRDPADLERYRELHELLVETKTAEELRFSATFRLDQAQIEFVNRTFREILKEGEGQIGFIELNPRPEVLPGQVVRVDLNGEIDKKIPEPRRAIMAARKLADWIRDAGLEGLRAQSWRDVAILCPRKLWFQPLRDALIACDIPVEIKSQTDLEAENPAYAWLTALLVILIDPQKHYEIVGVLREVFGLSDEELARFGGGYAGRFQIAEPTRGRGPVEQTLSQLVRLRQNIQQQPVFSAVKEIARGTQLRERLLSLPRADFPSLGADLDGLLSVAANAEARGWSLTDFALDLRRKYQAARETHPSLNDAVQLMTSHGAKGLEWQAVIVPFLTRKVRMPGARYPRIIRSIGDDSCQIVFDKTDVADFEEQITKANRQEMERLLYVSLTRSKHTLVLASDNDFFATSGGDVQGDSQLRWLRAEPKGINQSALAELPDAATECEDTAAKQGTTAPTSTEEHYPPLDPGWFDAARRKSARFLHTIRPSEFPPEQDTPEAEEWKDEEPDLQPPRTDNPATRYGVWWHQFAEQLSWDAKLVEMGEIFVANQATSPDPARSQREWDLLREHLESTGSFRNSLGASFVSRSEVPFFWRRDDSTAIEGVIDLTLISPGEKRCLILDWKTNRVAKNEIEGLRRLYLPQVTAYAEAVGRMTGLNVAAGIYSTATGELVIYEKDELAREWERLQKLPSADLIGEVDATD